MKKLFSISPTAREALTGRIADRAWDTFHLGIVLGVLLLLYALASGVGLFFYEEQIPQAQLASTLLVYSIVMALIALVNRRRGGSWAIDFGMGFRQLRKLALSPLLYLATLPFLMLAATVWHLLLQYGFGVKIELQEVAQIFTQELSWLQLLYILMAIIVAPLYEELMFRGMVFPYLVKRVGLAGGTVLVSLLFAGMHFHLPSFVPLLLLSAVFCLAYWRTGSLWVGIGIHAIFNGVSILALTLTR